MLNLISDPFTLQLMGDIVLALLALVSFALFVLLASFRGKNLVDWALLLREFMLFTVTARLFWLGFFDLVPDPAFRFFQWSVLAIISVFLLISLAREHVFYKNRFIVKSDKSERSEEAFELIEGTQSENRIVERIADSVSEHIERRSPKK